MIWRIAANRRAISIGVVLIVMIVGPQWYYLKLAWPLRLQLGRLMAQPW